MGAPFGGQTHRVLGGGDEHGVGRLGRREKTLQLVAAIAMVIGKSVTRGETCADAFEHGEELRRTADAGEGDNGAASEGGGILRHEACAQHGLAGKQRRYTGPILAQEAVPVLPGDDADRLHERIKAVERRLYPETIARVIRGELP